MWYWSVAILFWQLPIDHIVNGRYKRCGFAKTRLRHPSLPFDSLPYPTRTICRRVRTYVRSVSHVTTKQKEVDHILRVWGSVPAINLVLVMLEYISMQKTLDCKWSGRKASSKCVQTAPEAYISCLLALKLGSEQPRRTTRRRISRQFPCFVCSSARFNHP